MGKRLWNANAFTFDSMCHLACSCGGVVEKIKNEKSVQIDNEKRRKEMKENTWIEGWFEKCEELEIKPWEWDFKQSYIKEPIPKIHHQLS